MQTDLQNDLVNFLQIRYHCRLSLSK